MTERDTPPTDPTDATPLGDAVRVWRKAQIVYEAPSWEGEPKARAVAEEIARHPEYEPLLVGLLADPSQLVVAYTLLTLEMMGSDKLRDLPPGLLANRSRVTTMVGSFRMSTDLGGLARKVQKRASAPSV